jgi:hypothetical protein
VKPTEHTANTASTPKTGRFATLCAFLRISETGALKITRGTGCPAGRSRPAQLVAVMLMTVGLMGVSAASAFAAEGYGVTSTLGSAGSGAGGLEGPQGVAVNDVTKNVYVADVGNRRVDEFDAGGTFVRAFGKNVGGLGVNVCEGVDVCQAGSEGSGPGEFKTPTFVAVDNSTGASKGDVYVGDTGDNLVTKFSESGVLVKSWGGEGQLKGTAGSSPFGELRGVVVGASGDLWVYEKEGESKGIVDQFGDTGAFVKSFPTGRETSSGIAVDSEENLYLVKGSGKVAKFSKEGAALDEEATSCVLCTTGVAVAPATEDLFVDQGNLVEQYGAFGEPPSQQFGSKALKDGSGAGVAVSAAGVVYAVDVSADTVDVFTLGVTPEVPVAEAASGETASTVVLHGTLKNPKEEQLSYHFVYNTGGVCVGGASTPEVTLTAGEAKHKELAVSAKVTGLEPNQKYTFCLIAENTFGSAQGKEASFSTLVLPPTLISESVTARKATSATLDAQVDPNNQETTYEFEYATAATGQTLGGTVTKGLVGGGPLSGYSPEGQTASVETGEALMPGTTYYYRVIAKNEKGETSTGTVARFTAAITPETPEKLEAKPIGGTTATLNGVLNPGIERKGEPGSYEFRYRQSAGECEITEEERNNGVPQLSVTGTAPAGAKLEAVSAEATGLIPHTQYTFCLRAVNVAEPAEEALSAPVTFTTEPVSPTIAENSTGATEVTDKSAELNAQINPGGATTTYHFEYDTTPYTSSAPHGQSTPESGTIGSDNNPHPATAAIEGLEPDAVYHYRVVAHNAAGGGAGSTKEGPDATFTTQTGATGSALIDNRAWEQVSPVNKHGARIEALTNEGGVIQAADDGSAMTYVANGATEAQPEGNPSLADSQVMSVRNPAGGWGSRDIATPKAEQPSGVPAHHLSEFYAFSPDLSEGIVEPWRGFAPQLAANAKENTVFIRSGLREPAGSAYTALINDENTTPGIHYGREQQGHIQTEYIAASENLKHVIVGSNGNLPLTSAYPNGGKYEWTGGVLTPVTVLDNEFLGGEASIGHGDINVRNAVSEDGNHVFWMLEKGAADADLYMREVAQEQTVQLDLPNQGVALPTEEPDAVFTDATPDGEQVYFEDVQALAAGAVEGANNLYEYNAEASPGERLTDLTPGTGVAGEVIGAGVSGEYVYFVSGGKLAPNAQAEVPNLYVERTTAGERTISLVALLSNADSHDWVTGGTYGDDLTKLTSRSSPDGRFVAFMSNRSLTGYDNQDVDEQPTKLEEEKGVSAGTKVKRYDQEVFEYDAATGKLSCASCDPTGARPRGVFDQHESGEGEGLLVDRPEVWTGSWLAGSVPGWTRLYGGQADYQSRYLSDNGRLFFTAADSLVAQDTNGKEDVYEYEPEGVPEGKYACGSRTSSGSEVYKPGGTFKVEEGTPQEHTVQEGAGCVGLISSGKSDKESAFLDASGREADGEEGGNVFFLTAAPLASTDIDAADDVYDAHVCSALAPCAGASTVLPPCTTEASCKAAPSPQPAIFGAPASSTFSGAGNVPSSPAAKTTVKKLTRAQKLAAALRTCRQKSNKKARMSCEKSVQRQFGAAKKQPKRARKSDRRTRS